MLSTLRDYSSYFLWFVVITFVGFMAFSGVKQCGGSPASRGVIAEINGQPITLSAYSLAVSRATQNRQAESGDELNDQQIGQLRSQTWNQLVGALLLDQEADRRGTTVTDAELANFLRQYPPDELRKIPAFQTDGNFDYSKYLGAMTSEDPQATQFWNQVEAIWRPQLKQSKLQQEVISTVRVSDAQVADYYRLTHDAMRMEFVVVSSKPYLQAAGTPTQEELQQFYEQDKYRFKRFERVLMEVASWTRTPSAADQDWAKAQAEDIRKQIAEGADFAQMAEEHTMDPSGTSTGGDLGWFGKGAMVGPFEDVAFALKKGEVSQVVETQFGFHIIKLEDRRPTEADKTKEEIRARHILIKPTVSQATLDSLLHKAQDFAASARAGDTAFTQSSIQAAGGTWFRPPPVQEADNVLMVGPAPDLKAWAFHARPGDISEPIDDGGKYLVAKLIEKRAPGLAPLEEVQSNVQQRWQNNRMRELARPYADSIYALAKAGKPLKDLAELGKASYTATGLMMRNMSITGVGKTPLFMGAAFSLTEQKPLSEVVPVEDGWAFIHMLEFEDSYLLGMDKVRDSVSAQLLQGKQNTAFQTWVSQLYEKANIKDYRAEFANNL